MMWYWGTGVQWWWWLLGAIAMVVFWGLVIWTIVTFLRWARDAGPTARREEDPERILARRLAAGEIDAEEYHRRLDTLHGRDLTPSRDRGVGRDEFRARLRTGE
jgi:putative membrane protein